MKLCLPSYQLPGSWLFNLEKLADLPWVEGIELLFFSFDEDARRLFLEEKEGIAAFSRRFSFSLHLPELLAPGIRDLVKMSEAFVELYVFHPFEDKNASLAESEREVAGNAEAQDEGAEAWSEALEALRSGFGRDRFAMEYTGESAFERSLRLVPGIPLCADTGCLVRNGLAPAEWIAERTDSIVELHVHGARNGKDHFPLSNDDLWARKLAENAVASNWRVVFETFSLKESEASRDVFRRWFP